MTFEYFFFFVLIQLEIYNLQHQHDCTWCVTSNTSCVVIGPTYCLYSRSLGLNFDHKFVTNEKKSLCHDVHYSNSPLQRPTTA